MAFCVFGCLHPADSCRMSTLNMLGIETFGTCTYSLHYFWKITMCHSPTMQVQVRLWFVGS